MTSLLNDIESSDFSNWADSGSEFSSDDSSDFVLSDPELQGDVWKCVKCNQPNTPYMRYCHRCWEVRKCSLTYFGLITFGQIRSYYTIKGFTYESTKLASVLKNSSYYFRSVRDGFQNVLNLVDGNGQIRKLKVFPSRVESTGTMNQMLRPQEKMSKLPMQLAIRNLFVLREACHILARAQLLLTA